MARMRLLDLTRPFASLLPEIALPYQKVDPQDRLIYTVAASFIFVLLAEVPPYGTKEAMLSPDPVSWLRPALAMSHGTLAELGILPIVLAGVLVQSLAGLRKINVGLDLRSDRALFQSLQKSVALGIAALFSVALAFAPGYFGAGSGNIFVASQLFLGSAFIIFLDELLTKSYGLVPGTVLFSIITCSQKFVWQLIGLENVPVAGSDATMAYGIVPSIFANINNRSYSFTLTEAVFRSGAPNIIGIVLSVIVFAGVLYLSLIRMNLQVRSTRMRAQSSSFPVRLLYTGAVPVLFVAAALAALLLASFVLGSFLGNDNIAVQVLGQWDFETAVPVGGFAGILVPYYRSNIVITAVRVVTYTGLFGFASAWIANVWTQSSGFAPQDIAKQFKENSIVLVGKRDVSVVKELRRIIPFAATIGGAIVGIVVGLGDTLGPAGSGIVMSVAALNVFAIFEQLASEGMVGQDALQGFM